MDIMNKKGKPSISDEWGNFVSIPTEFTQRSRELTDQARWLFVLLREYTNSESGQAFPSYKLLQERTGWTPKTISKALKDLENHGWMERQYKFNGVTNYALKRPPATSHWEATPATSLREAEYVPTGSTILPSGTPIKIESTKIESTKINSLCESQVEPFDSLANGDDESVHAQQAGSAPIDLSKIVEDGFAKYGLNGLLHIGEAKPPTVHANGDSVTPPDTPAPPVTEKPQTDHQRMMAALDRVSGGRKILNGAAQGKAIKKILTGYTADQAIECLEWMADPQSWWNGNADWLSVQSQILSYFRRKEQQSQTKLGGNYGQFSKSSDETGRSKLQELCNRRALGDFG